MSHALSSTLTSHSSARPASVLPSMPGFIGFYLAARLALTYLFFTADPQFGAIVSVAINIGLLFPVSFYIFGSMRIDLSDAWRIGAMKCVAAYLALSFASLAWTAAVSGRVALGYWLCMSADVFLVLVLRGGNCSGVFELLRGFVVGACFIAVVIWSSPTMNDLRPGNDDFFSPNAIGFTCALGAYVAQLLARSGIRIRWVTAFLSITLLRTLSKTTIVAFVIAQAYLLLRDRSINRERKLATMAASAAIFLAFVPLLVRYYSVYLGAGNQAQTLTGRVGIWAVVLERSLEQPWIGHGFHGFRNVIPAFGTFEAWDAHNEWIQLFYSYGVLGVLLLAAVYGCLWRLANLAVDPALRTWTQSLVIFIVIRGLADAERFDLSLPMWAIAAISLALYAQAKPLPQNAEGAVL